MRACAAPRAGARPRVAPHRPRRSDRVSARRSSDPLGGASPPLEEAPPPLLIIPGFLSDAAQYEGMADALRRLARFASVDVVPLRASDWYPTLAGGDFRAILDAIDASATAASGATGGPDDPDHPDDARRLVVVAHSAGGWLARCWMGSRPYSGGVVYAGAARVRTLLTLGTPHYSLERYPFGRVPERRERDGLEQADDVHDETYETYERDSLGRGRSEERSEESLRSEALADLRARAPGSTLALTNLRYPGAYEPGVRYVAVCGSGARGAARRVCVGANFSFGDVLRLATSAERRAAVFAGVSYAASCGRAEEDGDGVCPVETAMLEGAERVVLEGVGHQPGTGRRWYGDDEAVARWAEFLL